MSSPVDEALREARAREWTDGRHPNCCWRCGWNVTSHPISSYGLDCPMGVSPAARMGHLPSEKPPQDAHGGRSVPAEGTDMDAAIQAARKATEVFRPPTALEAAIEAATKALGRASIGIQETADRVLAEAAVRAAAPLLRQAVAEEIAAALEAKAAPKVNPRYQETHYLLPEQAAAIAREIGARP